jgi:hypothetical protein
VGDLVLHGPDADGIDFLVFGRDEHAGDAGRMDILDFHGSAQCAVVVVHQVHCEKKGLVVAVIAAHDLDHPVDHFGTQVGRDLLELQTLLIILIILIKI